MNFLKCKRFWLWWRTVVGVNWRCRLCWGWSILWWRRWAVVRLRLLFILLIFDEINFRFSWWCRRGNWQFNLRLLIRFLHEHINQCFVLILRLWWDNWSIVFRKFGCFNENYLVMLSWWLNGKDLRGRKFIFTIRWKMNEYTFCDFRQLSRSSIRRQRSLRWWRPILLSR